MASDLKREPRPDQALPGDSPPLPVEDQMTSLPSRPSYRRELTVTRWIVIVSVALAAAIVIWGFVWDFSGL